MIDPMTEAFLYACKRWNDKGAILKKIQDGQPEYWIGFIEGNHFCLIGVGKTWKLAIKDANAAKEIKLEYALP